MHSPATFPVYGHASIISWDRTSGAVNDVGEHQLLIMSALTLRGSHLIDVLMSSTVLSVADTIWLMEGAKSPTRVITITYFGLGRQNS